MLSTSKRTMIHVGGYHEYMTGIQYIRGYHEYTKWYHEYFWGCTMIHVEDLIDKSHSFYVIMISAHINHNMLQCTKYPLMYSWYFPDVLNIPKCTEHIIQGGFDRTWNHIFSAFRKKKQQFWEIFAFFDSQHVYHTWSGLLKFVSKIKILKLLLLLDRVSDFSHSDSISKLWLDFWGFVIKIALNFKCRGTEKTKLSSQRIYHFQIFGKEILITAKYKYVKIFSFAKLDIKF